MNLTLQSTVKLNNGIEMPRLGLGTFQSERGSETRSAVRWALEAGYRHIDTAAIYGNEADVGAAIRESGIPREEIFITTKLWNGSQRYDAALRAYDESVRLLGVEQVDLYLVHWPIRETRKEAWRALLRLYEEGRVRAIGVSNYTVRHLNELLADSPLVPAVNQFEVHAFNTRLELVGFCQQAGIVAESYSPLSRGAKLNDPRLAAVARRYEKTPAQVLIRWVLQHGMVVIPKSVRRERILENADVFDFEISAQDLRELDGLDEGLHTIRPGFMAGEW
jgi:diketogulonate reductase-like aldo/keto reductase